MSVEDPLNIELLLTPISESAPSGVSLRYDQIFTDIKNEREQKNKSSNDDTQRIPDWKWIIQQTTDLLATRTKDLMLAGYLCEALLYHRGFAGFSEGVTLLSGLIENFWDTIHPLPDDGDLESRLAPLVWLSSADYGSRLPGRVHEMPLMPAADDGPPLSWMYSKSRLISKGENEDSELFEVRRIEAAERAERFDKRFAALKRPHFQALTIDIERCKKDLDRFDALITDKAGTLAPSLSEFRQRLDDCAVMAKRMLDEKGGPVEERSGSADPDSGGTNNGSMKHSSSQQSNHGLALGPITSREDAFRRLSEIAQYLRHTEPQSPVPYLVERAVNWGRLPFEKLLLELVKDATQRTVVAELLGIDWDAVPAEPPTSSEEN